MSGSQLTITLCCDIQDITRLLPAGGLTDRLQASPRVGVMAVLARVIEPPKMKAVFSAIGSLQTLYAIDDGEKLTALGYHLSCVTISPIALRPSAQHAPCWQLR